MIPQVAPLRATSSPLLGAWLTLSVAKALARPTSPLQWLPLPLLSIDLQADLLLSWPALAEQGAE